MRMHTYLILVWALAFVGCTTSPEHTEVVEAQSPGIAQAKKAAQEIAGKRCEGLRGRYKSDNGPVRLEINCPQVHDLTLNPSHLLYREYNNLPMGSFVLKFRYNETGFNISHDKYPENDANPAYYLEPVEEPR